MKRWLKLCFTLLLSVALVACGGTKDSSSDGKTVTVAKENDVISMDSRYATDGMSFEIIAAVTDGLMSTDKDGNIVPAIAESVDKSEDGLVYMYHLRDAKWSNGEPVTAHDFVYAWRSTITNPAAEYNYLYTEDGASILNAADVLAGSKAKEELGVKAIDEKTLKVTLSKQVSFFDSLMTFPVFYPVNEAFATEKGDQYSLTPDNLLSNGPYKMSKWEKGNKIVLDKNADYWDAANVKIDSLVVNIIAEASTAVLDFESGSSDFVKLNSDLVDKYKSSDNFQNTLEGYLWYLQFNLSNENLQNENLRKALAYVVDKDMLTKDVLKDGSISASGFVPNSLATGPDGKDYRDSADAYFASSKDKALKYWEEAKKELGFETLTLSLLFESSDPAKPAAEFIQSELKQLPGLTIEMVSQPKDNRLEMQKAGNFEVVLTRWGPDYADPTTYLALMVTGNSYNYGGYSSAEYDALYAEASNETDLSKRWDLLKQAEAILMGDAGVAPMFQVGGATLINKKVTGIEPHVVGVPFIYKNLNKIE